MKEPKETLAPIWSRYTEIEADHAEGPYIYSTDGARYLDFTSGIGVTNTGHCHPAVVAAAQAQVAKPIHGQANIVYHRPMLELAQELQTILPAHLDSFFFTNSGAEAVESCIKAARKWGYQEKGIPEGKAEIIACEDNFHGRTITIVGFSSEPQYRDGYAPFTPGFKLIPFGDAQALEDAITPHTVAFLVEPIQGEAGIIIPPQGYLRDVRRICSEHDIAMITDEIQTGLGRTGKLLAEEHEGIEADLTLARREMSGPNLAWMLIKYPLMTVKVVVAIYWQALRLWIKGAKFYTHPVKKATS